MVELVIKIDRLEIKTSGLSEETVRQSITRFSKEMSVQAFEVLRNKNVEPVDHGSNTDKLNAGNLYVNENDIQSNQLGKAIANKVLRSIVRVREGVEEESL